MERFQEQGTEELDKFSLELFDFSPHHHHAELVVGSEFSDYFSKVFIE